LTRMAKPGRNDPCHCGSGKKYKKCCQPKEVAAEHEELVKEQLRREEARRVQQHRKREEFFASLERESEEDPELIKASNAALDLVEAGRFEEAEAAARDLIERYPETHDGWDRLGMMHEAKGEKKAAADCYRKALEIIHAHAELYDPDFIEVFVELIAKLDPPTAGPTS
jgi:tetratricopeptide (TPR) repeat protein